MRVIADLHIHSRYSRATSKRLGLPLLDRWARIKGLSLLGAGDCTHPTWLQELREHLDDAEEGFYTLKEEKRAGFDAGPALAEGLPAFPERPDPPLRFVLTGEICTLYRQGGRTRKVHHLVILPDFSAAAAFQTKLEKVGNIRSDGRPILGINSRDLLALLLDADERALLIPAHIWTPWFSVLGAKSGFDSIEECYGDLSPFITAIETGLSSNPPMNWALSSLDRYGIISNSDAHSPDKLGREATILEMGFSYPGLREALGSRALPPGITGTIEFFPQEGKYHYDGHRDCGVVLTPQEAAAIEGLCPHCGKPLTRGVMGRVMELADRPVDEEAPCPDPVDSGNQRPYRSLIPLKEILGELLDTGPASKKVGTAYNSLIEKGGTEFSILMDLNTGELEKLRLPGCSGELLAAALQRMRTGEVSVNPGYDGEYGVIRAFPLGAVLATEGGAELFGELSAGSRVSSRKKSRTRDQAGPKASGDRPLSEDRTAPAIPADRAEPSAEPAAKPPGPAAREKPLPRPAEQKSHTLNREQEAAVSSPGQFALIIAGPGTGKTATLAARISRLIQQGEDPASILALSFTVKAAGELRERIARTAPPGTGEAVVTTTFHSLCTSILREEADIVDVPPDFRIFPEADRELLIRKLVGTEAAGNRRVRWVGKYIEGRKQYLLLPGEKKPPFGGSTADLAFLAEELGLPAWDGRGDWLYKQYQAELRFQKMLDFEDLVTLTVRFLAMDRDLLARRRDRHRFILVDEYQDINFSQYALIRLLGPPERAGPAGATGPSLWVIGDPNQAIYGFRGADKRFIDRFTQDYAGTERFYLPQSFRCAAPLTDAAGRLVGTRLEGNDAPVILTRAAFPSDKSEAEGIARRIAALIGGTSFFAIDSGMAGGSESKGRENPSALPCAPGDCAILIRTSGLAPALIKALQDHGIPFELTGEQPWWEEDPIPALIDFLRNDPGPEGRPPAEAITAAWVQVEAQSPGPKPRCAPIQPDTVTKLIALAAFFKTIPELLDILAISDPGGIPEINREGVKIMTIHASKGLEFDHVFVAGLEEGLLPFTLYDKGPEDPEAPSPRLEEERRLLYVAMTRARKGLYLSWARLRNFKGRIMRNEPSRFLADLETLIPLDTSRLPCDHDPQLKLF